LFHSGPPLQLVFIEALAHFHLGRVDAALDIFRQLERESETIGKKRIIRSYLASNPNGTPQTYDGTVRHVNARNTRGDIYIERLRRQIPFIPADLGRREFRKGEPLADLHIAFNYLGPILDFSQSSRQISREK
jgi:hypothetical protein